MGSESVPLASVEDADAQHVLRSDPELALGKTLLALVTWGEATGGWGVLSKLGDGVPRPLASHPQVISTAAMLQRVSV